MTVLDNQITINDTPNRRIGIATVVSVAAHLLFLGGAGLWARHATAPIIAETSPDAAQVTFVEAEQKTPPVPPTDAPLVAPAPSPTPTPTQTPHPAPTQSPIAAPTPPPTPNTPISSFANAPATFPYATPTAPAAMPTPQPPIATPAPTPFTPPPPVPAVAPKPLGFTRAAQIIALQNPDLPNSLRTGDKKISLRVRLDVDATGAVSGVTLQSSSGNPEIDKSATETLMQAKFIPALVNGTPAASTYPFTFTF